MRRKSGFTLAELLIALGILGVIAVFTIPKILVSQARSASNAKVKEAAAMISSAYEIYRRRNTVTANTEIDDLVPYLNYVKMHTSSEEIDQPYSWGIGPHECDPGNGRVCLKLHNGAMLLYYLHNFGGTGSTSAVHFLIDPDGEYKGTEESASMPLFLYYNGRLADQSGILSNTCNNYDCDGPDPTSVPSWFRWN